MERKFNAAEFYEKCGCMSTASSAENGSESKCTEPLTMVFINAQPFNEVYTSEMAFQNGTLFPELNKPFLGGARK